MSSELAEVLTAIANVDGFLKDLYVGDDEDLQSALDRIDENGFLPASVSATQGKFLHLLAKLANARNILEIGTLGGYSTIWMARAVGPNGRVITLEYEPKHAEIAESSIAQAGLADIVDVRTGAAMDLLPQIKEEGSAPFDLVFIDADKENNVNYISWAVELSRPGTVIVVDNIIWNGTVLDEGSTDANAIGARAALLALSADDRLETTVLQTVCNKGWDGFALAVVK
ncbi:O-methyltransferase [Kitasatospora sp. RB6PN24]|uniref:O-methyltransferase n=1 Tax=Kitasatospora humi TaxID=2893891 RepID=UPI001E376CA8|nr:O-methyltransferase [Kitasatospora humi]MCC9307117.1 O-methyltransferase [Kitasatospora humi]